MGKCTIEYRSTVEAGTGPQAQSMDFKLENDIYTATITLSSNSDADYKFTREGYHLKSWTLDYLEGSSGTTVCELGSSIQIKSNTGDDITYHAVTNWEEIRTLSYLAQAGDAELEIEYNRNITEYYDSLGSVELCTPVLKDKTYRFDHWECDGVTITTLNHDTTSTATELEIIAICSAVNEVAIYGREVPEVNISSEIREQYILLANSLSANASRTLIGSRLRDFYRSQHAVRTVEYKSEFMNLDCDSQVTEFYINSDRKNVKLNLYTVNRMDTVVILHFNRDTLFDYMDLYVQLGTTSVSDFSTTSPVVSNIVSGSTVIMYTDSDLNTSYLHLAYPIKSLMDYIDDVMSESYTKGTYVTTKLVTFPWSDGLTPTYSGRYSTSITLDDLGVTTYRDCLVSIDNNELNNSRYSDEDRVSIQRFFEFTSVTGGNLDLDTKTLDLVYDYIPDSGYDASVDLNVSKDIKYTDVPIKVVVII